jgi:GR25 family glycosyltransferase involved in LPS biosynthesis
MHNNYNTNIEISYICIHLQTKPERRQLLVDNAYNAGIKVDFIEAVTPSSNDILHQGYDALRREKRRFPMLPTEHACLQSHRLALEKFLKSPFHYAVILEDDAMFHSDIDVKIKKIINEAPSIELLKLENRGHKKFFVVKNIDTCSLMIPMNASNGTTGVMYSKSGAEKILRSLNSYMYPIDTHLGSVWYNLNLMILSITPSIVWENPILGSATGIRLASDHKPGLSNYLIKRIQRIHQSNKKRFASLKIIIKFFLK